MTTTSNTEIKQLKEYISDRFDKIDKNITDLKVSVARVEEKVTGIDKRLDSLETSVKDQDNRFYCKNIKIFTQWRSRQWLGNLIFLIISLYQ